MPFLPISRLILSCHSMQRIPPHSIRHNRKRYATRSDTISQPASQPMTSERSTPHNQTRHNQTTHQRQRQGQIKLHRTGTGTQRNLFPKERRPPAPSPHTAQTGEPPKSRNSSSSTQTPKIPCQYWDVTILLFASNHLDHDWWCT